MVANGTVLVVIVPEVMSDSATADGLVDANENAKVDRAEAGAPVGADAGAPDDPDGACEMGGLGVGMEDAGEACLGRMGWCAAAKRGTVMAVRARSFMGVISAR